MAVTRLALTDFRSYPDALIAPGAGFVVLTGENGAGKTNVLEAVSLLTAGRGLRQANLSEMARSDGPGGFAVAARLEAAGGEVDIGVGTLAAAPERRQVRINGAAAAATALGQWLSILWLTPTMDRLFTEGASGRRRFLDRLVLALEPGHAAQAARYDAAMRARNKLLAEPEGADAAWLAALEIGMAEHGAALAEARQRTVAALAERLKDQPAGPFARAGLALDGWRPGAEAEADLAAELKASRGRDAAAGRTAPTCPSPISTRRRSRRAARPANRRRCCSASCWPMPTWWRRTAASGRSCCSTKWRPISMRCAARHCSAASPQPGAKCG
jgi:DNA replication and repair protein RecF